MRTPLGLPVLFLGLSGENVTRLIAGEPIVIQAGDLDKMGLPSMTVVIHYGKTEQAILDEIATHGVQLKTTDDI
jgi:hypothetical protein